MAHIFDLFGESPFGTLKAHGEVTHECLRLLREVYDAFLAGDQIQVRALSDRVAALETEADRIQNRLHEQLSGKVLVPVDKVELFGVIEAQDTLADRAEDLAAMLTYRSGRLPEELMTQVTRYLDDVLENCRLEAGIISRLDLLVESSFGGRDALTVSKLVLELSEADDRVKVKQVELNRRLFAAETSLGPTDLLLWWRFIDYLADLSRQADNAGAGIRLMLKLK